MARRPRGQLEADVLDVLWEGGWRTPGQVCAAIAQPPSPAYSTVLTTLRRLWKKGLVERRRDGRGHAYHAVRGREEHAAAT
ncbi:MAG: BlaI/MecI/CopY family transcriptional regulator, partial [Acidimicrobiales bacterium]